MYCLRVFRSLLSQILRRPALMLFCCFLGGLIFSYLLGRIAPLITLILMFMSLGALWWQRSATPPKPSAHRSAFGWLNAIVLLGVVLLGSMLGAVRSSRFHALPTPQRPLALQCLVQSDAQPVGGRYAWRYQARLLRSSHHEVNRQGTRQMLLYLPAGSRYMPGDTLQLSHVALRSIQAASAGRPAYQRWLRSQSLSYVAYPTAQSAVQLLGSQSFSLRRQLTHYRHQLGQRLQSLVPSSTEQALLNALVMGQRSSLESEALRRQFSRIGMAHLLVVSGFHVAVVVGLVAYLFFALSPLRAMPRTRWFFMLVVAWLFTLLTGLAVPTVRAALMFSFYVVGRFLYRHTDVYNILALSALLLLIVNPDAWLGAGFQLSYVAVLSILLFMPRIEPLVGHLRQPLIRKIWQLIAVCLSAQILLIPLLLYHFGQIPYILLWANVPMVLLSIVLIPVSVVALLLPPIAWVGRVVHYLSAQLLRLLGFFGHLPVSPIEMHLPLWGLLLMWLMALFVVQRWSPPEPVYSYA